MKQRERVIVEAKKRVRSAALKKVKSRTISLALLLEREKDRS